METHRVLLGGLVSGLLVASLACQQPANTGSSTSEEVRRADVEFDLASGARDLERWADLVAEDAVFFGGSRAIEGRQEVVETWAPLFEPEGSVTLRWQPVSAEVSSSGDLGYTRGRYQQTVRAEDGTESLATGWYVTIWRRSPEDGRWRAVLDIGTPPEPVTGD
jgi:ketosteroid isomerase-like protein